MAEGASHMSEVQAIRQAPRVVTGTVLCGNVCRRDWDWGLGTLPVWKSWTTRRNVLEDTSITAGLVAIRLLTVGLGGFWQAGASGEVPHAIASQKVSVMCDV